MGTRGCFPLCKAFPLLRQYLPQGDLKWCNYMGCSESWSLKRAFGNRSVGKAMSGICPNFPPCSPSFPRGWGSENKQAAGHLGGYKWPAMPKHVLSCKYLTPTPSSSCWQLCSLSMQSHTEPAGRFSWERALVAPHCSSCHSPMFVPATWHRPRAPSGPHPVPLESPALKPALSFPAWRKRYCFQACMDRAVLGPAAAHAFLSHPNHAPRSPRIPGCGVGPATAGQCQGAWGGLCACCCMPCSCLRPPAGPHQPWAGLQDSPGGREVTFASFLLLSKEQRPSGVLRTDQALSIASNVFMFPLPPKRVIKGYLVLE